MSDVDRSTGIPAGAAAGAAAWLAYGAVETAFVMVVPRVFPQAIDFRYLHHEWATLLLVLYGLAGATIGAAIAAVAPRLGREGVAAAAGATVPAACAANLVALSGLPPRGLPLAFLAVAVGTAVVLLASVRTAWRPRLRFAANRWTVALLLTGPAWITKDYLPAYRSTSVRAGAALAFCAAVLVLAAVREGIARRKRSRAESAADPAGGPATSSPHPVFALIGTTIVAAAALTVGTALNRVPPSGGAAAGPPVVVLVLDTVRADHLKLGDPEAPTSPRLRALARDGIVFPRSLAAGDMTLSTHASLFTGKYPREHGAHHPDPATADSAAGAAPSALADRFDTLAELLREKGYRSYGIVANHGYLGPFFRLDQGFDYWDSRAAAGWTSERYLLRYGVRELVRRTPRSPFENDRPFRSADDIHSEVDALIERLDGKLDGTFLFVNYMDAHFPYLPPPPFDKMFPGRDPSLTVAELDRSRRGISLKGGEVPDAERAHLLSQYDGAIAYLDSRVGMLVDRLKSIGAYDDALIVVTSDHGEAFGERGLIDHGVSVYGDQVRVPLLVKPPAGTAPAAGSGAAAAGSGGGGTSGVDGRDASSVDLLPTVLQAVGVEVPEGVRGESLLAPADRDRPVFAEHYPSEMFVKAGAPSGSVQRALRTGDRKLVRNADGSVELYDLAADPLETRNLARERPEEAAKLAARLDAWLAATPPVRRTAAPAPDDDANERLKALGYVQ